MLRNLILVFAVCLVNPVMATSQGKDFILSTAPELEETGFLQFIMPRFSLKTGIRPRLETKAATADAFWDTEGGQPVMEGLGRSYFMRVANPNTPAGQKAQRFADWLASEIGQRTIEQFKIDEMAVFSFVQPKASPLREIVFEGDVVQGEILAFKNCARCHEIGTRNLMKGIGSTPSFGLLRGLPDWQERFMTFYLRLPHPSITQIEGITEPFDQARPPTIHPLLLTEAEVEDILTFVATVEPVDLGAPLVVYQ